jgi:uncharacterized membrane protein YozB (DUF420 family)
VIESLPAVNAGLNSLCVVLLLLGRRAIARGDRTRHRKLMLAALVVSALFLTSYTIYHAHVGVGRRFPAIPYVREAYLALLASHVLLAIIQLPLVIATVACAWLGRFAAHRRLARPTYAIWLYVSASGVLIYLLLYQIFA